MRRWLVLFVIAGCGRIGFTSTDPDAPLGHDEDEDGVADTSDTCPHLDAPQADTDADGVGDACDPHPNQPGERIALFATMTPIDQPFVLDGAGQRWAERPDAAYFDGIGQGVVRLVMPLARVQLAAGIDVLSVLGDATTQHQISINAENLGAAVNDLVELNHGSGYSFAGITEFDGTNYVQLAQSNLATDVHPGRVFLQGTFDLAPTPLVRVEAGWPGEMYTAMTTMAGYAGGDRVVLNINNLELEVRWMIVIVTE